MADIRPGPSAVTVSAGTESVTVRGRAAVIIWLVVKSADLINTTNVGRAVVHFASGKAHLELRQSLPAIRRQL